MASPTRRGAYSRPWRRRWILAMELDFADQLSNYRIIPLLYRPDIPRLIGNTKSSCQARGIGFGSGHDSAGLFVGEERSALMALARDGSVTHRLARRANALVLLDDGMSCEQVSRVLLLDD